ncbi:MAG: hypothetical protein EON93_02830, partial [Burkholderiales bacterium]
YRGNDTIAGTTTTNASGLYSFTGLMPGSYYVIFDPVAGYLRSVADQGADTSDSDANVVGRTPTITLIGGQTDLKLDAGYFQPGIITGSVLADANNDNIGDVGISGVVITLKDGSGNDIDSDPNTSGVQPTTTTTDASGNYTFSNLTPGSYQVVQTQPAGYLTVTDGDTTTPGDDAANTSTTDNMIPVTVTANETDTGNDFIEEQPGTIRGTVWADTNNDSAGDIGIVDVTMTLFTDPNGDGNPADGVVYGSPVVTVAGGTYTFASVPPGSYVVVQTQPAGYLTVTDGDATTPGDDAANSSATDNRIPVAISANETDDGNDFVEEQPGVIRGSVLADTDGDGDGDAPLANVLIHLLDAAGNPVDGDPVTPGVQAVTTLTLSDGSYSFGGLAPGNYRVREDQPAGYNSVSDTDGANNNVIGDQTPINVTAGGTSSGHDFIEIEPASIAGHVFADSDNNGSGDAPLAGVTLTLLDGSGNPIDGNPAPGMQPLTAVTLADGSYLFADLPPGTYRVSQAQPTGYASVSDVDGANNNLIGDETPIVLLPGDDVTGRDFVEVQYGSIAGSVFDDTDDNGTGDAPIAGVTLALLDGAGQPVLDGSNQPVTTVTLADGSYLFANVLPGSYQVAETQPSGYGSISDVDGGNLDLIGNGTAISVAPGEHVTGRDFIEIRLAQPPQRPRRESDLGVFARAIFFAGEQVRHRPAIQSCELVQLQRFNLALPGLNVGDRWARHIQGFGGVLLRVAQIFTRLAQPGAHALARVVRARGVHFACSAW